MGSQDRTPRNPNGSRGVPLKIPLAFEDALRAATETKPSEKPKKKRPAKKT